MEVRAPNLYDSKNKYSVFLAGSIEMGSAENWQKQLIDKLPEDIIAYNPRRAHWDLTWRQTADHPQFRAQVEWELEHIEKSDLVVFYFDPSTRSPVTLLELGSCIGRNTVVCCPDGFWRKGNVDIFCQRYRIKQVKNIDQLSEFIQKSYQSHDFVK